MRIELKSDINVACDIFLAPVSERMREEHKAQILSAESWKNMTTREKKKEVNKPIYLIRYE
jgi:hypothetical protein